MSNKIGLVFPGQGSQSVGMLSELAEKHPTIKKPFQQAKEVLGYDLWDLVQNDPEGKLNQTQYTQPALLVAGYACYELYRSQGGVIPDVMAGHSLGEYTALVCSGGLSFDDGVKLVALRGQFMQEAVPQGHGAMAAVIGLDDEAVIAGCQSIKGGGVTAANFNSPGQVVIAGEKTAVDQAMAVLKEKGAKRVLPLPVSVPSHCHLMQPAADRMQELLENTQVCKPEIPVIQNADVKNFDTPADIMSALVRQLVCPVRWVETIEAMDVDTVVECGPGNVLTGLNKRIKKGLNLLTINNNDGLVSALKLGEE